MQSTTDNSTPEGRPKTETKDGLLLRGACETKTMHAKEVFGKWWGRRGRTRNQKTNQMGSQRPCLPGAPFPSPGPGSPAVNRSFLKEHLGKELSPASQRIGEGIRKISGDPSVAQAPPWGLCYTYSQAKARGLGQQHLGRDREAWSPPSWPKDYQVGYYQR